MCVTRRVVLVAALAAAITVACSGGRGNSRPSSFATGSGVVNGRVAVNRSTVFCVDRPGGIRTCFHYGMDAEVPEGLRMGDEVTVVLIDGLVDRVVLTIGGQ